MSMKMENGMLREGGSKTALTHNYVYLRNGKIFFSEELLKEAIAENGGFQEIKVYENAGCGNPKNAWIGSLTEMCVERMLGILGVGSQWERSEFVNRKTDEPDFINKNDGMTLEIRGTRIPNALYLKPKDVRDILAHETKQKACDVYIGYTVSWDGRGDEMKTLREMFADDYTGERPHLKFHGFTTRGLLANMIRNFRRVEMGDRPKPVFPKPLAGMITDLMQVCSAEGRNNTMKGRMLVEAHSLFNWDLLEKFLTHEIHSDKWDRGIHLLAPNP
jgi:hypothetical protein